MGLQILLHGLLVWTIIGQRMVIGEDVSNKRFDPPRAYFTHANLNKNGFVSAIKGQENFLSLYFPAIDNSEKKYEAEGFSFRVLLPSFVGMLDVDGKAEDVHKTEFNGRSNIEVRRNLDPKSVFNRCLRGPWGIDQTLWFQLDAQKVPDNPQPIRIVLYYRGKELHHSDARLRVYEALTAPPPVDPKHFKLWLHYGPHTRPPDYDGLAGYLRKAGINTVQTMSNPDFMREMKERGFFVIAQRGGSYMKVYRELKQCLELGPKWFEKEDGGVMKKALPFGDAVLWDFEPGPGHIELDEWTASEFAKKLKLDDGAQLSKELIQQEYFSEWIEFRQKQYSEAVKHWVDFCRSFRPDIQTIVTEGRSSVFDPPGQIDYRHYGSLVTYCDPMNFTGVRALHTLRTWMKAAPNAQFTGCQNVAAGGKHNVFISAKSTMLQILGAMLVGARGTSIYPGHAMDGENFVLFNRVMGFIGRNQQIIFKGKAQPPELIVLPLPKEDLEVRLGDGRTLRNIYPDWDREAIHRSFFDPEKKEYLAVLGNWNGSEPCYFKLNVSPGKGSWSVLDDESSEIFQLDGSSTLSAAGLEKGIFLKVPPFDYRGFRIVPAEQASDPMFAGYRRVELADIRKVAMSYTKKNRLDAKALAVDQVQLGFDDFDSDNQIEYLVQSPRQKLWISQKGTILRWQADGKTLRTAGHGLLRDMIWLPQTERSNVAMDSAMTLESRKVRKDRVELSFNRIVSLETLGAMASLRIEKALTVFPGKGKVIVKVKIIHTSLSMELKQLDLSYRVHNHLDHTKTGSTFTWIEASKGRFKWDGEKNYSALNTGLSRKETGTVFGGYKKVGSFELKAFGEYFPKQKLSLACVPQRSEELLQVLRWRAEAGSQGRGGSGTIEWMYRPISMAKGDAIEFEYEVSLKISEEPLAADWARDGTKAKSIEIPKPIEKPEPPKVSKPEPRKDGLLFHLDFEDGPDAVYAAGNPKASVKGALTYEKTPGGRGIRITGGAELSYLPEGNFNLARGKLYMKFKPLWDGVDQKSHYLLTVTPLPGYLYFGKLNDGRLIMNMFDVKGEQHYPWHLIRTMKAETWHTVIVTWDCSNGRMTLYLDGRKVAGFDSEKPWKMGRLDNTQARCRLVITQGADAVIDEVKIWDRPE